MDLTPEQAAKAKVLFEYEEAKKALAQRRDDIQIWGKALIATGEALLNHPGTIVLDGAAKTVASGECLVASGEQKATGSGERKHPDQIHNHHTEESPAALQHALPQRRASGYPRHRIPRILPARHRTRKAEDAHGVLVEQKPEARSQKSE